MDRNAFPGDDIPPLCVFMKSAHTSIAFGFAGVLTLGLAFAPAAFATEESVEPITEETMGYEEQEVAPFLDLMYAAPHMNLAPGDTTTVVIAQTTPAAYTLVSYMSNGAKCFAPYDTPAANHTKTGTETDADHITRTIVATNTDTNNNGIDDWYDGLADENGVVGCKIKATDEHGNLDWKYIYINVGLPKTYDIPTDTTTNDPTGEDFDTGATTTTVTPIPPAPTSPAPAAPTTTANVAGTTVTPTTTATLPRTGTATWIEALIGTTLAAAGAAMVTYTRRRTHTAIRNKY